MASRSSTIRSNGAIPGGQWKATQSELGSPSFLIVDNSTGLYLEATKSFPGIGYLKVIYELRPGNALKHTLVFTSTRALPQAIDWRVWQVWEGILADSVSTSDVFLTTSGVIEITPERSRFKFNKGTSLSVDENQFGARHLARNVTIDLNIGMAKFLFYNATEMNISPNESFIRDPDTFTSSNPTLDGNTATAQADGTSCPGSPYVVGDAADNALVQITPSTGEPNNRCWRLYIEWPITSITDGSTITNVVFKYDLEAIDNMGTKDAEIRSIENQPSDAGATGESKYLDAGNGTIFVAVLNEVVGNNKEQDLGTSADSDLEANLVDDWWAIGLRLSDETRDSNNHQYQLLMEESASATPNPTLEVTYTPPPTQVEMTFVYRCINLFLCTTGIQHIIDLSNGTQVTLNVPDSGQITILIEAATHTSHSITARGQGVQQNATSIVVTVADTFGFNLQSYSVTLASVMKNDNITAMQTVVQYAITFPNGTEITVASTNAGLLTTQIQNGTLQLRTFWDGGDTADTSKRIIVNETSSNGLVQITIDAEEIHNIQTQIVQATFETFTWLVAINRTFTLPTPATWVSQDEELRLGDVSGSGSQVLVANLDDAIEGRRISPVQVRLTDPSQELDNGSPGW